METNFQTSFIPKKPMMQERVEPQRSVNIFTIVSLFILFTVLLVTGGFYFYKGVINNDIIAKDKSLSIAKNGSELPTIVKLQILEKRLKASTEILANHISVNPIFTALHAITEKTVRFTKFGYDVADSKVNVKMSGIAINYHAMALQSDLFSTKEEGKNFIDPVFSNLTLDDKGNVHFDLAFSVDRSFVNYQKVLAIQEPTN